MTLTREEELAMIDAFIQKNGATLLPPDERGADFVMTPWKKPKAKRGRKKTKKATKTTKKQLTKPFPYEIIPIETVEERGKLTYKIIRFYKERHKSSRVIKRGLTLEQAQAHCQDPSTRKEGEWFDGYESEDN